MVKKGTSKGWRDDYLKKFITAQNAAMLVKSGDRVMIPLGGETRSILEALQARAGEVRNVEIFQGDPLSEFAWLETVLQESFTVNVETAFRGFVRDALTERRATFTPDIFHLTFKPIEEEFRNGRKIDVGLVVVSPPDENGFCSFGESLWNKRQVVRHAGLAIAEVDRNYIRTYGQNDIHVSELDYFVDHTPEEPPDTLADDLAALTPPEGTRRIAQYVSEIVKDGDTIQIGYSMNTMLFPWMGVFDNKKDLGWHSEITPPGIATLVKEGVFNGKRKNINIGKMVCTKIGGTRVEKEYYTNNPAFELHDVSYVNDPVNIAANDNVLAINGALLVDFTGQITVEALPSGYIWNGAAGAPEWVYGALRSKGGRSLHALNSTDRKGKVSRIVPTIPEGIPVTIPRYYADIVVTENGVAHLLGKSLRDRAEALISIAHPYFRAELRKQAQKLFWP